MTEITLPTKKRGRPRGGDRERYLNELQAMADAILEIQGRIPNKASSRGWCYLLEGFNIIDKSQFSLAEGCINEARKLGLLPIDFVLEEDARSFINVDTEYYSTPKETLLYRIQSVLGAASDYRDAPYWDCQDVYIQMLVEKVDLKELFGDICRQYHIPIATARGWSSISQRNELAQRYKEWEAKGKTIVLLYCGDHDPAGLMISDTLLENFHQIELGTGWKPDNLIIDRFGLNYGLIMEANLTWIDNLVTAKGNQPDISKAYVRGYIELFGERKVEANALQIRPDLASELVEQAINKYLPANAGDKRREEIRRGQAWIQDILDKADVDNIIDDLLSTVREIINEGG